MEPIEMMLVAGLLAGAVSIFTGVRGLQSNKIQVSAFSAKALTGSAARRVSWACIAVGAILLAGMFVMIEKM